MAHHKLSVRTRGAGLYEITDKVHVAFSDIDVADGILTLFVQHTSCSLLIQENADPTAKQDLQTFFAKFVPPADHPEHAWMTHRLEGDDDMPAHVKASVLPTFLSIPLVGGRMALGTWQGIYLFEHRRAPHVRNVVATIVTN